MRALTSKGCARSARGRLAIGLVVAAGAVGAGAVGAAQAGSSNWCLGCNINPNTSITRDCCGKSYLVSSVAYDDYASNRVCAAAKWSPGDYYGSHVCGSGFAQHDYAGSTLLYAVIRNGEDYAQQMHGLFEY